MEEQNLVKEEHNTILTITTLFPIKYRILARYWINFTTRSEKETGVVV